MSITQAACFGGLVSLSETRQVASYVDPQASRCLSRYEDSELVKTRVSGDQEVRVYDNGGWSFVGVVIGVGIPIPLGVPLRETIKVKWDSGTCTIRETTTKQSGCMAGPHFEQGFVAQCSSHD
jgi:hypothetical protein